MHLSRVWIFLSQISVYKSQMLTWARSFFSYRTCPCLGRRGCFQGLAQDFTQTSQPSASQCLIQFLDHLLGGSISAAHGVFSHPATSVGCAEAFISLLVSLLCCQWLTAHIFPPRARWTVYSSPGTSWRFVNRCRKYCQLCVSDISQLFSWLISLKVFFYSSNWWWLEQTKSGH